MRTEKQAYNVTDGACHKHRLSQRICGVFARSIAPARRYLTST